jgi:hypothetical protein
MQLGSGTFDFLPGLTYLGSHDPLFWGSQVSATLRLGKNDNGYALGDSFGLSTWIAHRLAEWLSMSARLQGQIWGDIEGADSEIVRVSPMMVSTVPTAEPGLRSGKRIDLLFGIDLSAPQGKLKGGRLAIEGGFPVYQYLDGPQLETDWLFTAGLQWTF